MPKINRDILTVSLILIFISSVYASQNYHTQSIFAQNDSSEASTVLSCEFVQFCSKPTEISTNIESSVITPSDQVSPEVQTTPEDEVQTTPETSVCLLPSLN